jgi:perosamine synthetase
MHQAFQNKKLAILKGDFENSIYAYDHCLVLPLFHDLTFEQQEFIVEELKNLL